MFVVDVFPTPASALKSVVFARFDRGNGTNCRHRLFLGEAVLV